MAAGPVVTDLVVSVGPYAWGRVHDIIRDYISPQNCNPVPLIWVPYVGPPQSFTSQSLTRDGSWTMVANKDTSDRPAPQPSGAEEDLLPTWTPVTNNARATYTVYNEWTTNASGWIDQYGVDVLSQNLNATHTITLRVNGTVRDTFTTTPEASGAYLHDITPLVAVAGSVIRVTLQVTQTSNNLMYWYESDGLFVTLPPYCSSAVGSKDGAVAGTNAYGCHLLFIPGTASPDWDVVAFGGGAAGAAMTGLLASRLAVLEQEVARLTKLVEKGGRR
jgi:hypothetical protein